MQKRKLPVRLLGLLFLTQACQSNKDAVLLKFNLQKGKTYTYSMNMDIKSEAQGQKISSDMDFDYSMKVVDDQASVKTINASFDHIAMKMKAGNMDIDVDTNTPVNDSAADVSRNPAAIMGAMFNAMKGKSFGMKVTDKGEITQITGLRELSESMVNSVSGNETMKAAMQQAFQTQFNEETVKQSFGQSFNIYPDKPVKVGDSWQKEMKMSGAVAANVNATYTVKDVKPDRVSLDLSSNINAGGATGKQSGTMEVDPKTGLVLNATLNQQFDSPMSMHNTINIKGKEM